MSIGAAAYGSVVGWLVADLLGRRSMPRSAVLAIVGAAASSVPLWAHEAPGLLAPVLLGAGAGAFFHIFFEAELKTRAGRGA